MTGNCATYWPGRVAEMAQGHADMPQLSEEAIKKAHTAKKYIENLYRMQEKNLRDRNER